MTEYLEFDLNSDVSELKKVLRESNNFFATHGIPKKISNEQTLVITKLTRFLALYDHNKRSDNNIKIKINIDNDTILIEALKSASSIDFNKIEKLEETVQFIRGFQDPYEAFKKLRTKIMENNNKGKNLLEIAKIACKGNAHVDFFVDDKILNLSSIKYIND